MSEPPLPSARRQLLFAKYGPFLITPFYFGFSAHVLSPGSLSRFLGPKLDLPITNTLWLGSQIGAVAYLFTSKHLRNAESFERLLYSIYGAAMFNFGIVLIMSVVRSIFPDSQSLRLGVGLTTSAALLYIGKQYVNYIDKIFDTVRFRPILR